MENTHAWSVPALVLGVQAGVPDTEFTGNPFDYVYSTTTLEMIRGMKGEQAYREGLAEIYRVLKPGGLFGLGEPMHFDVDIPADLAPLVMQGNASWADCFANIQEMVMACKSVGFDIIEADYAPDARLWWEEYAAFDPFCQVESNGDRKAIQADNGRWLSYGYVIGKKPAFTDANRNRTENMLDGANPEKPI